MGYKDSETGQGLGKRARRFVDEVVLPMEREHSGDGAVSDDVIDELREVARDRDVLRLFEQAGQSLLGGSAMHLTAPEENMYTIELVGTEEQKEEYLEPLIAGEIYSAFSITEARRRLRPEDAEGDRQSGRRRVGHRWPQVVNHDGVEGGCLHRNGADRLTPIPTMGRACSWFRPTRTASR